MKTQIGNTYAQIVRGKVHWLFTSNELPEWNADDIQVVDVTAGVPTIGQDYVDGVFTTIAKSAEKLLEEKAAVLAQARDLRDKIFSRLNGIQQDTEWQMSRGIITEAVAIPRVDGIVAAKEGLKGITTYSTVVAATTGAETVAAIKARYTQLVTALYAVNPYACTAFSGLEV